MAEKRKSFSERMGLISSDLQYKTINDRLKNGLWNVLYYQFHITQNIAGSNYKLQDIYLIISVSFLGDTVDSHRATRQAHNSQLEYIRDWYFDQDREYYQIYDFINFLIPILDEGFIYDCNNVLEHNLAGYRIIDGEVAPVTSDDEIEAITTAVTSDDISSSVKIHLKSALKHLSNQKNPDFRNSIKESISAVESACVYLTGDRKHSFGQALNKIDLPPSLKKPFHQLYGFTSNEGGIRHRLLEDDIEIGLEEARFMLVACSAFVNYLFSKGI